MTLQGGFGAAPPPDVAGQVSQPISDDLRATQLAKARANDEARARGEAPARPEPRIPSVVNDPPRAARKPQARDDGMTPTGGFGMPGSSTYTALNGAELRNVVSGLMGHLQAEMAKDLRFTFALTYPRVKAEVVIRVTGYTNDQSFDLVRHQSFEGTPEAIASAESDPVSFEVVANAADNDDSPPDAIRNALDLPVPQKRIVGSGSGAQIVDRLEDEIDI